MPAPYPPFAVRWLRDAFMMTCTCPACLCRGPPLCGLFLVTRELVVSSARERHGMSLAPYAKATEEESTMALVHTQIAWGYIVGVMLLGGLAGCSLKDASVPLPAGPHAHTETAPVSIPQAPAPQTQERAPAGQRATVQIGTASWYGPGFHGRETASGETFNQHALTAAHRTLPLGTEAKVTNLETGQSVQVKINDRGPYVPGRHLDLSQAAAKQIGITKKGVAKVKIEAKPSRQATQ